MGFDRFRDDIPLSNAIAQVNFWLMDLASSQNYLSRIKGYEKYNFKFYPKMLKIAEDDLKLSLAELAKAKARVQERTNEIQAEINKEGDAIAKTEKERVIKEQEEKKNG